MIAALRLGIYELLFADGTPDHAAVDQAVELVKRAGAAHASGLVNAVLRRAAREREALAESLLGDDSTPEAAAVAHSAPLWLAQMWWQELGAEERPLAARRLQRARRAGASASTPCAPTRGGAGEAARRRGRRPVAAGRRALAAGARAESIVVEGQTGDAVPELVAAGELTPQSRGSAAVVEVLDPQPGEHVLDLCAGPGIKTGQIAARMGDRGEVISVESDPDRAAEVADQARRLGLRSVTVIEADATEAAIGAGFDRVLLDAPCSDLGALASRPDARWRKSPATIERLVEVQDELLRSAAGVAAPGRHARLLDLHDLPARERGPGRGPARASAAGEVPPLAVEDLGARAPGSPRRRAALPPAPPRPRPHHRLLHRPPEAR